MKKCKVFWLTILSLLFFAAVPAMAQEVSYSLDDDLIYRINFGSIDDVRILLGKGANPNTVSTTGDHALNIAVGRDDDESAPIVKALLDKGANPNLPDKSGTSPLVNAVVDNKTTIVSYLIAAGADYHVKSPNGRTLVEIAQQNDNHDIAKLIQDRLDAEKQGANPVHTQEEFKRLVHQYVFYACSYQYWDFVLGSRQNPDKDKEINTSIGNIKADLTSIAGQLQNYYPNTQQTSLTSVADNASQQIYTTLNNMVSNRNRESQGVGTKNDADARCQKLSDQVTIDFAPSALKQQPAR